MSATIIAPQAASVIHTGFERAASIGAQTIAFDDLSSKGEAGAKEAGKMRAEGKGVRGRDGDVNPVQRLTGAPSASRKSAEAGGCAPPSAAAAMVIGATMPGNG